MINLKIISSDDFDILGDRVIHGNTCFIGSKAEDIIIESKKLKPSHLLIEVVEQQLLVHPLKGVEYFLLNGKRATNLKKIKPGDIIQVENTEIEVKGFEFEEYTDKASFFDHKLQKLREENSPLLEFMRYMNTKHLQK